MTRYHIPRNTMTRAQYTDYVLGLPFVFAGDRVCYPSYEGQFVDVDGTLEGGTLIVPEPELFATTKAEFLTQTDTECDDIYFAVMGFRDVEYINAEAQALAYQVAGYTGTVPTLVAAYASGAGITAQAAAEYTLQLAAAWRPAMQAIRAYRTAAKTATLAATNEQELDVAKAAWTAFVANIRAQLGV